MSGWRRYPDCKVTAWNPPSLPWLVLASTLFCSGQIWKSKKHLGGTILLLPTCLFLSTPLGGICMVKKSVWALSVKPWASIYGCQRASRRSVTLLPQGPTCCFSGDSGQTREGSALFPCSSNRAALCSSTKALLSPGALTPSCAWPPVTSLFVPWVPAEFPPSWSSWTSSLAKKSCSGFSELARITLTQNCHFLGSSDTVKLVCSFFFPPLFNQN